MADRLFQTAGRQRGTVRALAPAPGACQGDTQRGTHSFDIGMGPILRLIWGLGAVFTYFAEEGTETKDLISPGLIVRSYALICRETFIQ